MIWLAVGFEATMSAEFTPISRRIKPSTDCSHRAATVPALRADAYLVGQLSISMAMSRMVLTTAIGSFWSIRAG